jgi:hypothetical protein
MADHDSPEAVSDDAITELLDWAANAWAYETPKAKRMTAAIAALRSTTAPHDACEWSRDCIACGKRIEPANALCFKCAITDPKVRAEATRSTTGVRSEVAPAILGDEVSRG